MGWIIATAVPLVVLQLQEIIGGRKHRRELALQQARRDESIANDIGALKSTADRSATVLESVRDDLQEVRERLVRVETRISP